MYCLKIRVYHYPQIMRVKLWTDHGDYSFYGKRNNKNRFFSISDRLVQPYRDV